MHAMRAYVFFSQTTNRLLEADNSLFKGFHHGLKSSPSMIFLFAA